MPQKGFPGRYAAAGSIPRVLFIVYDGLVSRFFHIVDVCGRRW